MGMFKSPKAPKPPEVKPLPPAPSEQSVAQKADNQSASEQLRKDRRRGAASNYLTGEQGLSNLGGVVRRNLLGG
jgi:hypothetical protein